MTQGDIEHYFNELLRDLKNRGLIDRHEVKNLLEYPEILKQRHRDELKKRTTHKKDQTSKLKEKSEQIKGLKKVLEDVKGQFGSLQTYNEVLFSSNQSTLQMNSEMAKKMRLLENKIATKPAVVYKSLGKQTRAQIDEQERRIADLEKFIIKIKKKNESYQYHNDMVVKKNIVYKKALEELEPLSETLKEEAKRLMGQLVSLTDQMNNLQKKTEREIKEAVKELTEENEYLRQWNPKLFFKKIWKAICKEFWTNRFSKT